MADRAVVQTGKGWDGDIVSLCNPEEFWSPRLKGEAITDIETGRHRYYVPWTEGPTWIRVVHGPNVKYLRTDRDDTPANNLDDLPDCHDQ